MEIGNNAKAATFKSSLCQSHKRHTGIPGLWTQELDAGLWALDSGRWTLDTRLWTLNATLWTLKL